MKGAVIYARYSCERQTEQSIEGQLHECYKYAEKNGLSILGEYIDRATTGTNDNRPAFQKMLADSERTTAWDIVLVYAIDRFGRNSIEIAINKQKLIKNGKNLISATQRTSTNIDGSKNLDGILLENVYIGLAEYYSAELSQKIRRGLAESREKGLYCGGQITYGYKCIDKKIYINDGQAEIVREVFQKYQNGITVPEIIDDLTKRNILNKGTPFWPQTIYKMLRNEKYIGITRYNGKIYKNIYPPIIDEGLFQSIREKLKLNKCGTKSKDVELLLKGKLFCGYCGKPVQGDSSTSHSGKRMHYYKCSGRKKVKNCNLQVFRQDKLEPFVFNITQQVFCTDENLKLLADKVMEVHKKRQKDESLLAIYQMRLENTTKSISNLIKALQEGIITKSTKEQLENLEKEKEKLEANISIEKNKLSLQLQRSDVEEYIKKAIHSSPKVLLSNLIEKIILYDDKMEIYYKYCNIPADPTDDQRESFFTTCNIDINKKICTKKTLDVNVGSRNIYFQLAFQIKAKGRALFLPVNYKNS